MGMTKKQAKDKIQPLLEEIECIKKDLREVKHPQTISAINLLIREKEKVLGMLRKHANS